jgi:hypothetical protein
MAKQKPKGRTPLFQRLLRNRYAPESNWVTLGDVIANAKEIFYRWSHRVPPDAVVRWSGDRITGHYSRRPKS